MLATTRTSDVTLHGRCRRAWYYQVIRGVVRRPKAHLDRGTLGHADVERWLYTGQAPRTAAGRILIGTLEDRGLYGGMASDPTSGVTVLVEWAWQLVVHPDGPDFGAVTYTGQADLIILQPGQPPILIDHKTLAMLDAGDAPWAAGVRGALSAEDLHVNVQLRVYSHAVLTLLAPTAEHVVVMHNAAETRGRTPHGRLTGAVVTRAEALQTWGEVMSRVSAMRRDAQAASPEDVPGDCTGAACAAFGGCPYKSRCSTWARLQHTPAPPAGGGESLMSMLDELAGPAPESTPAPATERVERHGPAEELGTDSSVGAHALGGGRPTFHLYIDSVPVPVGGEVFDDIVPLEQYLAPLVAEVCRRADVPHYAFIDGWVGKGRVASLLEANLPAGRVLVDSRLPLSPMAIEVLCQHAATITRGVR